MAEEHFSIESLAVYLHLTPLQVQRLADRGRLPGHKVGGQWRFASADSRDELRELQVEMIDRFGLLPEPCKHLFRCAELRLRAIAIGLSKIEASGAGGRIEFADDTKVEPINIVQLVQKNAARYQLDGANALRFKEQTEAAEQRIEAVERLLDLLAPSTT